MFCHRSFVGLTAAAVLAVAVLGAGAVTAQGAILVAEDFNSYSLGTHISVAPPPSPGDFPTLNGGTGWGTPFRSHIGAGLDIVIASGPSGGLFDGTAATVGPTAFWRDRIMASPILGNSDGAVIWQSMFVSTAGIGGGSFRVNNSNGGMDYRLLLDAGNHYGLNGGQTDLVTSTSSILASTSIGSPDFVLTRIENVAGGMSTASTWINPILTGGEAGLGAPQLSVTYSPFAGNRNIGEINIQPGPNIRLDRILFGQTFNDVLPPPPTPFNVLIDIGPPTGQLEPGAVASGGAADGANGANLTTTPLVTPDGASFTLAISNVGPTGATAGGIDWRDRGNAGAQALTRLAEDFVKNGSGIVRVTLGTLPQGVYTATSYHLDADNSQSEEIKVLVADGRVGGLKDSSARGDASFPGHPLNTGAPHVAGLTTAIVESKGVSFTFYSNGVDPVTILFDGSAAPIDREVPLNGLRVTQISSGPKYLNYALLDFGPAGQRVEPGYTAVGTAANLANNTALAPTQVTSLFGDKFTVALSAVDWRDRGDSTSTAALARLGEDFVKNNAGDITVTLGGLAKGTYLVASHHIDTDNTQSPAIEVYVTDALGTDVLQPMLGNANFAVPLNSLNTDIVNYTGVRFLIESNGTDNVVIRFNGTGADLEVPLNGLSIQMVVPEPSTLVLAGLGLVGLIWSGRRRRGGR